MKFKCFAVIFFAAHLLCGGEAGPFEMTDSGVVYEFPVEFDSAAAAEQAQLEFLPLPEGKRVAFSTRWDDSNPNHVNMAALLTKYGFRGTFYLTSANRDFCATVLPKLISGGHSVGNHTLNHRDLTALVPNEISRQILRNRVDYEAKTDREVVAFALPYCRFWRSENPDATRQIGEALRRAGALGSPEYDQNLGKKYGMHPEAWSGSMIFTVNDRNPDAAAFDREVEKRLKLLNDQPFIHMTLGMHTWQNSKGFATLGQCFEKYGSRPEWWYCNENEYLSYRFLCRNTEVLRKRVEGAKAIFTLKQAFPAATGADVPLWARVKPAARGGKGLVALPNPDLRPKTIDAVFSENGTMQPAAKFPGLSAGLKYDAKKQFLQLMLVNATGKTIAPISATYRLPLLFGGEAGEVRTTPDGLNPGGRLESELSLSQGMRDAPVYRSGPLFFAVELNFTMEGERRRLWVCATYDAPAQEEAVPRDRAMVCGPFEAGSFNPAGAKWSRMENPAILLPGFVKIPRDSGKEYAVRLNVVAERAADYPLHLNTGSIKALYVNGKQSALKPLPAKAALKQGRNEVIAVLAANGEESVFSLSEKGDPNRPLTCEAQPGGN